MLKLLTARYSRPPGPVCAPLPAPRGPAFTGASSPAPPELTMNSPFSFLIVRMHPTKPPTRDVASVSSTTVPGFNASIERLFVHPARRRNVGFVTSSAFHCSVSPLSLTRSNDNHGWGLAYLNSVTVAFVVHGWSMS